jgi:hypothetical protein
MTEKTLEAFGGGVGSDEHAALLALGYKGMTKEIAENIITERKQDPHLWPLAEEQKARAFLAALSTKPVVVSKRQKPARQRTVLRS